MVPRFGRKKLDRYRPSVADIRRNAIAARPLVDKSGVEKGVLRVGIPKRVAEMDWVTAIHISGLGIRGVRLVPGGDAVDCLLNAFTALRALLRPWRGKLNWQGGDPGDIGIPMMITRGYGHAVTAELEDILDRETARVVGRLIQEAEMRRKPAAAENTSGLDS